LPSRARVSRDGRYAVATVFTAGDDYESEFSTRTTLFDTQSGELIADLEQFTVLQNDRVISEVDFNFWGVTFSSDRNRFFATLGSKGKTHLVAGEIAERRMRVLRPNVECPSLSPDEKRIVFKSRVADTRGWRLHALELSTDTEWTLLAETRSVDDQVEWLDNEHVLYRILEDRGLPENALNIWTVSATAGATEAPRIFSHGASTPSVQR
jgi:dipeptidyl aminopeptidase/acylaminoacyl peptidase